MTVLNLAVNWLLFPGKTSEIKTFGVQLHLGNLCHFSVLLTNKWHNDLFEIKYIGYDFAFKFQTKDRLDWKEKLNKESAGVHVTSVIPCNIWI